MTTPRGLPLAAWDKASYDQMAGFLESRGYRDILEARRKHTAGSEQGQGHGTRTEVVRRRLSEPHPGQPISRTVTAGPVAHHAIQATV